jgi:hypothetical protein
MKLAQGVLLNGGVVGRVRIAHPDFKVAQAICRGGRF